MPLQYKTDIIQLLKDAGYNTNRLRTEKLISESVLQHLRSHEPISWANIERICQLLGCQPGDIIEYKKGAED